ncbi:hypothetical protein PR003_g18681 [Phytophthora rubi]|uniref:CBM1 domain-containing protein n=1 Tax=Phytophthora rubi TaxID=129364 RepID=A0A6A4E3T9_9STRA|nr:hypothetical protein PR001_g17604 [Phytophthora rubi]KAE9316569.1 hypothetical protein PR003_g18681 [Phytophthora rubi]
MRVYSVLLVVIGLGVSSATQTPGLWEQCRAENGTEIACGKGLVCVPDVEYYGLCYVEVAGESEQCGGLGWNVSCVNGTTCERQNEGWASCESTTGDLVPAAEWQQCDPEDSGNACADNLICVDDGDYHGLCVQEVAELWGQCGGSGWTTDCEDGSFCEIKTATYSQCVSDDSRAGDSSVGDAETLTTGAALQGALSITISIKSIDVSSLARPLAQLKELANEVKNFQCSVRTIVFPDTICDGSD